MSRYYVAWIATLLVAGCETLTPQATTTPTAPPPPPEVVKTHPYPPPSEPVAPVPIAVEPPATVRVLAYYNRTRQRPAREVRGEYEAVRRAYASSKSDTDRIRLALLLSLPQTGFSDDNQALELLEPLARNAGSEFQGLAQLMTILLNEQRRTARHASALQQKLDRIRALEQEMQRRAATPESKKR